MVKARVGQLEAEEVLPVDARPHRLRGPPIGQVLAELQEGDQRRPRRQPRLPQLGEQVGEVGIGEDGADSSRRLRRGLPLRKAARATLAVASGTGWIGSGLSDMAGLRRVHLPRSTRSSQLSRFRQRYPADFGIGVDLPALSGVARAGYVPKTMP